MLDCAENTFSSRAIFFRRGYVSRRCTRERITFIPRPCSLQELRTFVFLELGTALEGVAIRHAARGLEVPGSMVEINDLFSVTPRNTSV